MAASACAVRRESIPARGQHSVALEVGAARPNASVALDIDYRLPMHFESGSQAAWVAWIDEGTVSIGIRVRDDRGRVFETAPQALRDRKRWIRLTADLTPAALKPASSAPAAGDGAASGPVWPIEVLGYRVIVPAIGRQVVYLDDLEVEHSIGVTEQVRTRFFFDQPTQFYEPGATVRASLELENRSRRNDLRLTVTLTWVETDGTELAPARSLVFLPASSINFRSRQVVDIATPLVEPGLYRLVARIAAPGWPREATDESAVAVTQSNRGLPRGRSTFFGVHTDLLRQPPVDRQLEIALAREIGVQLLVVDAPWRQIEPEPGSYDLDLLESLVDSIIRKDIAIALSLTEPPADLTDAKAFEKRQGDLLTAVVQRLGRRAHLFQSVALPGASASQGLALRDSLQQRLDALHRDVVVLAPSIPLGGAGAADALRGGQPFVLQSGGDALAAVGDFRSLLDRERSRWPQPAWWLHQADPPQGLGSPYDATSLLRLYLAGAERGAETVIWCDLRDQTNDPRFPARQRGLVRRDFSPRLGLIGFANTVGLLSGLRYTGKIAGASEAYESAMFIGADHQVGVLVPRLNEIPPALLSPSSTETCQMAVLDFQRRVRPLYDTVAGLLTPSSDRPLFFSLAFERAQTEDRLVLRRPWIDLPSVVPVADEGALRATVLSPVALWRTYLQLQADDRTHLKAEWPAAAVRAKAGVATEVTFPLAWKAGAAHQPETVTIQANLEGARLPIPVRVTPLAFVRERTGDLAGDALRLGSLQDGEGKDSEIALYGSFTRKKLYLAVALHAAPSPALELRIGLALEKRDRMMEASVTGLAEQPAAAPLAGTDDAALKDWRVRRQDRPAAPPLLVAEIPVESLALEELKAGQRLLLAVRLRDEASRLDLRWGDGLDGQGFTSGYRWIELAQ